jgi:hypothetical protein
MTDAELLKQVALAIGYAPESVRVTRAGDCFVLYKNYELEGWRPFSYRSPDVAMPLLKWLMAEQYDVCPHMGPDGKYWMWLSNDVSADTLEAAIARAVIEVSK